MKSIFDYTDYRSFLADFYNEKKAASPLFTYRFMATNVGFKSAGHFTKIIQGKANISVALALRFADFFKFNRKQTQYFQSLVLYNQATVWVAMDTIKGNIGSQQIVMLWGNPGAAAQSDPSAPFDTSAGFQGVWHLGEPSGGLVYEPEGTGCAGEMVTMPRTTISGSAGSGKRPGLSFVFNNYSQH